MACFFIGWVLLAIVFGIWVEIVKDDQGCFILSGQTVCEITILEKENYLQELKKIL